MTAIDTRVAKRDSMFLAADLFAGSARRGERIKIRNLSATGLMGDGELEVRLRQGMRAVVDLRNIGLVTGVVAWVSGRRFGIHFEERIDPSLARSTVFGGDKEAPVYARPALEAPRHDGWNGKLRRL